MIRIAALSFVMLAPSPLFAQCDVAFSADYSLVDRAVVRGFVSQTSGGIEGGLRNRLFLADLQFSAFNGQILQHGTADPYYGGADAIFPYDDGGGLGILIFSSGSPGRLRFARDGQHSFLPGNFTINSFNRGELYCATVFDDGSGPDLYVGGDFLRVDGNPAPNIARWDGSTWTSVGAGLDGVVSALHVHDFGAGPVLVAGGGFTGSGMQPVGRVASWDGSTWSVVGSMPPDGPVRTLATWNDGATSRLVAGGLFDSAGGQLCNSLASFGLGVWSPFGGGVTTLGSGEEDGVRALHVIDEGSGAETLLVGGRFSAVDGVLANSAARFAGGVWTEFGQGLSPRDTYTDVFAFGEYDFPNGSAVVVGGDFLVGPTERQGVARRAAGLWVPLVEDQIPVSNVFDGVVWDDGNESMLYVAGAIGTLPSGDPASYVARRRADGTWEDVGAGLDGTVHALTAFDGSLRGSPVDASGVYAIGRFGATVHAGAGNVSLQSVARFDGTSWLPLGSGLDVLPFSNHPIEDWDLEIFDDGSGPRLFAVGGIQGITATGNPTPKRVAVWDGVAWAPVPVPDLWTWSPACLKVWDDGSGPALFVGGSGQLLTGEFTPLLRFDGGTISPIVDPGGNGQASDLAVHDDGSGEMLWISGSKGEVSIGLGSSVFSSGGLATWDGTTLFPRTTPFRFGYALGLTENGSAPEQLLLGGSNSNFDGVLVRGLLDVASGTVEFLDNRPATLFSAPASSGKGSSIYVGGPSLNRADYLMVPGFVERQRICSAGESYCFGEGTTVSGCTPCPCGNDAPFGSFGGCLNVSGEGTRLVVSGNPSVANDTLRLEVRGMTPLTLGVLFSGENRLPGNPVNPCFGADTGIADANAADGLRCMGGATTRRHGGRGSNADGAIGVTTPGWGLGNGPPGGLISFAGFVAGQTRHFQVFHRDAIAGGCGTGVNTSQGVTIVFTP